MSVGFFYVLTFFFLVFCSGNGSKIPDNDIGNSNEVVASRHCFSVSWGGVSCAGIGGLSANDGLLPSFFNSNFLYMYSIGKHVRIGGVFTLFGDVYSDLICGGVSNSMLQLSGVLKWSYNVFGGKGICYGGGLTISIMFGSFIENFNPNKSCQYF